MTVEAIFVGKVFVVLVLILIMFEVVNECLLAVGTPTRNPVHLFHLIVVVTVGQAVEIRGHVEGVAESVVVAMVKGCHWEQVGWGVESGG